MIKGVSSEKEFMKHFIGWFVDNPIAVNLLTLMILAGGIYGSIVVKKEVFPSSKQHAVEISMLYPGAAPREVEEQVVIPIEEAIADIPGIFQITSESKENAGMVTATVVEGFELPEILNQIKTEIDSIDVLPDAVESLKVTQQDRGETPEFLYLSLYGGSEKQLKAIAYQIKDEMPLLSGISSVRINGLILDEISIEVSEKNLRKYHLTFEDISEAVERSSLNLSAGTLRTESGNYSLQTRSQAYTGDDFAKIVVRSEPGGGHLYLEDIAVITDGFAESDSKFLVNGEPGLTLILSLDHERNLFEATENAKKYIRNFQAELPLNVKLSIYYELKEMFDDRFELLKVNAIGGFILVFVLLSIFLRPSLAFWVVFGIAISFSGTLWALPLVNTSFNMLSMMGFMIVLGLVVDDAIIVGESIHSHQLRVSDPKKAATAGTMAVIKPVILAIISTLIFITPMVGVPNEVKAQILPIFFVMLFSLSFSLLESLTILPAHLARAKHDFKGRLERVENLRNRVSQLLEVKMRKMYEQKIQEFLQYKRYVILSFLLFSSLFIAVFLTGGVGFSFFPDGVQRPFFAVSVKFPGGTPSNTIDGVADELQSVIDALDSDLELLSRNRQKKYISDVHLTTWEDNLQFFVALTPENERIVSSGAIIDKLESMIPEIPEAISVVMGFASDERRPDIQLNLSILSDSYHDQVAAVEDIVFALNQQGSLTNMASDLESGGRELKVSILPYAQALGVDNLAIAQKLRYAYHGYEIQRIPRSKENVRVMLRYPNTDRQSTDTLSDVWVRTPDGLEIPIEELAVVESVPASKQISRVDGRKTIVISADVVNGVNARKIVEEIIEANIEHWEAKHRGISLTFDGVLKTQEAFGKSFKRNLLIASITTLALFMIVLRSVFMAFLIMLAVPFGMVGAIIGHVIFQHDLSIYSFLGLLACSGVVVNDNLILLTKIRELESEGLNEVDATIEACSSRFRAIVLTSVTTLVGTAPLLFESSSQAQILIPVVLSLSFGVLFSTLVTLFFTPFVYLASNQLYEMVNLRSLRGSIESVLNRRR